MFLGDRSHDRKIKAGAPNVCMSLRHDGAELSSRSADIAERFVYGAVELVRQFHGVAGRDSGHGIQEVMDPWSARLECLDNAL